jgi:NAD(P)-dependent dehydrogenase (short-subunit alcohol dehydrogenase family)
MADLGSIGSNLRAAVIGSSGGIGRALVTALSGDPSLETVYALSRSKPTETTPKVAAFELDLLDETTIAASAAVCGEGGPLDLVIVASGILHDAPSLLPEKTWKEITPDNMAQSFAINCTGPALVAKHFLPMLNRERRSVFAALSARVGSIDDNRLGGWYAYRASKAALNMIIRNLAIELARTKPGSLCIGLHPGTVETALSEPFRSRVPADRLFRPERAARQLLDVVAGAEPEQSGRVLAWDGSEIEP